MSKPSLVREDTDMTYAKNALERAAKKALELGRRTHTPVWVVRDGVLVDIAAEAEEENGQTREG